MPTHDGRGCVIRRSEVALRHFTSVRELRSDREVHDAMFAQLPILGRTRFFSEDGQTEVCCKYPVTLMNARHDDHRWQVDTGPVLLTDFSLETPPLVGTFRTAFVVYHAWDWAEIAIRQPQHGVMHLGPPRRIAVQNQLFCANMDR
jgi:hypothetical protein